jgi:hypothetical protein
VDLTGRRVETRMRSGEKVPQCSSACGHQPPLNSTRETE